jgi:hypothetical protein
MKQIVLVLILSTVVMAQTRPTTAPSVEDLAVAVEVAKTVLAAATAKAEREAMASDPYKTLAAEVEAARAALEEARRSGTPQERLDASSAYNKARLALEPIVPEAVKNAPEVIAATRGLRIAESALSARQQAIREAEENDPINVAIREKRLVLGMTLEQARKAMGRDGKLFEETEAYITYAWDVYSEPYTVDRPTMSGNRVVGVHKVGVPGRYQHTIYATFEHGKLTSHQKLGGRN